MYYERIWGLKRNNSSWGVDDDGDGNGDDDDDDDDDVDDVDDDNCDSL